MNSQKRIESAVLQEFRIARVSTVPFFVFTQLKHQIAAIARAGASVVVVCSDGPELARLKELDSVQYATVEIPRSISIWQDFLALLKLIRILRRKRIHIAHSTTPKAGLLTSLAAFIAGVPVRLHTFTGQPWVHLHGVNRWLARAGDWIVGKLNTRCYADSPSQRSFLIKEGLIADKDLSVIGMGSLAGVDVQRFDRNRFSADDRSAIRRSLEIPDEACVLLFVGRITVDKGVRELLYAFRLIQNTTNNVHLVFVGQFDETSGVAGVISRSEIECIPNTHVVGYSDCPEAFMAMADVLCLPSYREGFGTVVIEAAAMGLPTVGTDIYGLSDAVVQGETGLLVPPRDPKVLSMAIDTLVRDGVLRRKMAEAAMQRVRESFDAETLNSLLVQEYVSLLQAKGLMP